MVKFWKEHVALRMVLMLVSFVAGLVLIFIGWDAMPGTLSGLGVMFVGLACLLFTLWLYNKPFQTPKDPSDKKEK